MDTKVKLPYGSGEVEFDVKGAASVETILPNPMKEITDVEDAFIHSVEDEAIGGVTLKDAIKADDEVTIVVSDITRSWMHQERIVPLLVDYLHNEIGLPYENMIILIANGTHRAETEEEFEKLCTKEVTDHVKVINHLCDGDMVYLGDTANGTPIEVNPLVVGRKVIIIGGTVHHVIAGFGGGRKNILPGVSSRKTIQTNHSQSLDPKEPRTSDLVGPRKVKGNPVAEDMAEAAHMVHVDFGINLVVAESGLYSGIFSGDPDASWEESCRYVSECFEIPMAKDADVILCSTGGYPKDINLYQGSKGMLNLIDALKPGGILFWACECREGGGQAEYFDWLKPLQEGHLEPSLRADFTIDGYIFFRTVESAAHGSRTYVLTSLDPDLIRPMGLIASSNVDDLISQIDFTDKKVYVVPYGGNVVPV